MRNITYNDLIDKIHGCWYGKCLGGAAGAPKEGIKAVICPGNPELAAKYAYIDAALGHAENSVYAEQFLAAAESIAFFESDIFRKPIRPRHS